MPRRSVILGALMAFTMVLFSCQKQEDETIPVLKVPQAMVPSDGGTQNLEVAATSAWTLSVLYEGASKGWIELAQTSGAAGVWLVSMTVFKNTVDEPRSATIVLSGPTIQTKRQVSQMGGGAVAQAPLWMELPVLDDPHLYFFTHDWEAGQYINKEVSPKRNFSFYWDPQNYVSIWVAYPLNTNLMTGKAGRYEENGREVFPQDPILKNLGMKQPDLYSNSYGGSDTVTGAPADGLEGWTRGHQIPSFDRQQSVNSNKATFFGTNMTPQQYDFNGGIWAKLEGRVRSYAKSSDVSDTLYVCTGCDLSNSLGWSSFKSGVSARVPGAYYKALLRKKGNSYSAAAYYLPHDYSIAFGSDKDLDKYLISVSELEKKVGVDFFATLPAVVGKEQAAAIESADPGTVVSKW